jgi:hypothetical protein
MARRQGQAYWQKHLEAWFQSELTQEAYCTEHGLSIKTFYRWRRKEKDVLTAAKSSLTLVPVSVGSASASASVIRLHSPGGWRIELPVGSAPWLADVLRHLP